MDRPESSRVEIVQAREAGCNAVLAMPYDLTLVARCAWPRYFSGTRSLRHEAMAAKAAIRKPSPAIR